ncbi:MAG: type III pantothenate kinase [Bdellovibrionales bacterium]|nr:type III pantothenate kinase [Bdellovibrionales bacterium]
MLLAFDIGNTNIVVGCFEGKMLRETIRLKTVRDRTIDEYAAIIFPLLERKLGSLSNVSRAIISSVVPPVVGDIEKLLRKELGIVPTIVGPGIRTGLAIRAKEPAAVGADRVVNAVAAKQLYPLPCVVIDFGTATSFDVINSKGEYEGGIIAPGIHISLDALVSRTAKLPRIQIEWPEAALGRDTESAMRSGVVLGYKCMVDGLVDNLEREVGALASVVATGGSGRLFAEQSLRIRDYEPNLTLLGLRFLDELNCAAEG